MSFKYINPGYSKFLIQYDKSYMGDIVPTAAQSRTGVAFFNRNSSNTVQLPSTPNEYWASCDFFYSNYLSISFGIGYCYCIISGSVVYCANSRNTEIAKGGDDLEKNTGIRRGKLNKLWVHVKAGAAGENLFEIAINSKRFSKIFTDRSISASSSDFSCSGSSDGSSNVYFSNIIISDEEILPYETIVPLTVGNTVTDMEARSGTYVANAAGQVLYQTVDTSLLAGEYGSDAKVSGIAMIGNPAYEEDEYVTRLTTLTKKNNVVTEHDTLDLTADTDAMILSSFTLGTDTKISDLANMQFGWRAGTLA